MKREKREDVRIRFFRPGLCPVCNYDLRATPTRCPECGAVPTETLNIHAGLHK